MAQTIKSLYLKVYVLDLAQLVCLSLSLAEPGKIMNILFVYSFSNTHKNFMLTQYTQSYTVRVNKQNFAHMSQDYLFSIRICFS